MPQPDFKKLQKSLVQSVRPRRVYELIAKQVQELVEDRSCKPDLARLDSIPVPARTIYWIWRFQGEAGICGMDKFLLDHVGIYAPQIHAALKDIGAHQLVHLLEAAIPLARDDPAEFQQLPDQSWFEQFHETGKFTELADLNRPTFALAEELDALVLQYIRSHERVLLDE